MFNKKTIVYIISLGHSGSTLLGNVIGSHTQALHIGEIVAPLQRNKSIVCQSCGDKPCPIWGSILNRDYLDSNYQDFVRYKLQGRIRRLLSKFTRKQNSSHIYDPIFAHFPNKSIVVDNSKNILWARYHDTFGTYNIKYIFLYRDLRAIWASHLRKQKVPSEDFFKKIENNIVKMRRLYSSLSPNQKHALHYESFVTSPEREVSKICKFLDIDFQSNMLRFYKSIHHTLGANRNTIIQNREAQINNKKYLNDEIKETDRRYYVESTPGFRLDERWRKELSKEDISILRNHLGQANMLLGYDMDS